MPADPTEHARRVGREWQDVAESYTRRRMRELGIPRDRVGSTDHFQGLDARAFHPQECDAGGVSPDGRINVDAGILNPEQMSHLASPAPGAWRKARLRGRIDAAIAHEDMEWLAGSHESAVDLAPETDLPVEKEPRKLLRAIRLGSQGFRGGASSPPR